MNNTAFDRAYALTAGHEGGYANNPADKGGETAFGISRRYNPAWHGWAIVDRIKEELRNERGEIVVSVLNRRLSANKAFMDAVKTLSRRHYWQPAGCDEMHDEELATEVYDAAFNCGVKNAIRFLQQALNELRFNWNNKERYDYLSVDGIFGNRTLSALNQMAGLSKSVIGAFRGERYIFHKKQIAKDASQARFMASWASRIGG